MAAIDHYLNRPDTRIVGGLPETALRDGRSIIRVDDITAPDVKAAFLNAIHDCEVGIVIDPKERNTTAELSLGYDDTNVWWRFAWRWKNSTRL